MAIENTTPGRGYQVPAPSNYLSDDVLRIISALNAVDADMVAVLVGIAGKAPAVHAHEITDVTGLSAALAGMAAAGHTHSLGSITGVSISGAASGQVLSYNGTSWVNATLTIGSITGLTASLASLQSQIDANTASITALAADVATIDGGTY